MFLASASPSLSSKEAGAPTIAASGDPCRSRVILWMSRQGGRLAHYFHPRPRKPADSLLLSFAPGAPSCSPFILVRSCSGGCSSRPRRWSARITARRSMAAAMPGMAGQAGHSGTTPESGAGLGLAVRAAVLELRVHVLRHHGPRAAGDRLVRARALVSTGVGVAAGLGASATFRRLTGETVGQVRDAAALVGREGKLLLPVARGQRGKVRLGQPGGGDVDLLAESDEALASRGRGVDRRGAGKRGGGGARAGGAAGTARVSRDRRRSDAWIQRQRGRNSRRGSASASRACRFSSEGARGWRCCCRSCSPRDSSISAARRRS